MNSVDLPPTSLTPFQTWLAPWGLSTCVRAVLGRSTLEQDSAFYPSSPTCSINCLFDGWAEVCDDFGQRDDATAPRRRFGALSVTGPQSRPLATHYGPGTRGVMVVFYPDAWSSLTGVSADALNDQVLEAAEVLPPPLLSICRGLLAPGAADARVNEFFDQLLPLWRNCARESTWGNRSSDDWRQSMSPWMTALGLRAAAAGWGRSLRQSERRIKQWTGWSMRSLQGAARGEAAFFAVMEAMTSQQVNWTQIALDHGFADQSHFVREVRRITGFSPEAMRRGVSNEEAFWVYRAWAQLAGVTLTGSSK